VKRTRLNLRLRPAEGDGAQSWLSLSGPLPTASARRLRRVILLLSAATGEPVHVVLFAGATAGWSDAWSRALGRRIKVHVRPRARSHGRAPEQLELFGAPDGVAR
jgi:hypothetical protein